MKSIRPTLVAPKKAVTKVVRVTSTPRRRRRSPRIASKLTTVPPPSVMVVTPGSTLSPIRAKRLFSKKRSSHKKYVAFAGIVFFMNYLRTNPTEFKQPALLVQQQPPPPGFSKNKIIGRMRQRLLTRFPNLVENNNDLVVGRKTVLDDGTTNKFKIKIQPEQMWKGYKDANTVMLESDTTDIVPSFKRDLNRIKKCKFYIDYWSMIAVYVGLYREARSKLAVLGL